METKRDEIRISTDAMIALVVTEAEEREMAAMPSLKEMNEAFHPSEQFQQKMTKLLRAAKSKERKRRWARAAWRTAACFMAVITLFTSMMLPARAVREAVIATLIEWHENFMNISFFREDAGKRTALPAMIELGYVPEGFALQEPVTQDENLFFAIYAQGNEMFTIQAVGIDMQQTVAIDNKQFSFYSIQSDTFQGLCGISDDMCLVLWTENDYVWQIIGNVDMKLLMKVAENIKK